MVNLAAFLILVFGTELLLQLELGLLYERSLISQAELLKSRLVSARFVPAEKVWAPRQIGDHRIIIPCLQQ